MSILNFSQHRNQYSNLSILLDFHLFFKDLRARKLNLLDKLDITVSYKTVHRVLKQLERKESNTLTQADQSELAVTAYDNFEQVKSIKSQRLDDNNIFHSVTTEKLMKDADISADDLTQNMLRNASLTLSQAL